MKTFSSRNRAIKSVLAMVDFIRSRSCSWVWRNSTSRLSTSVSASLRSDAPKIFSNSRNSSSVSSRPAPSAHVFHLRRVDFPLIETSREASWPRERAIPPRGQKSHPAASAPRRRIGTARDSVPSSERAHCYPLSPMKPCTSFEASTSPRPGGRPVSVSIFWETRKSRTIATRLGLQVIAAGFSPSYRDQYSHGRRVAWSKHSIGSVPQNIRPSTTVPDPATGPHAPSPGARRPGDWVSHAQTVRKQPHRPFDLTLSQRVGSLLISGRTAAPLNANREEGFLMSQPNPEVERESMEVDVLYVGAGPATLASAYHLMNQVEASQRRGGQTAGDEPIEPPTILVLEKAASVGDHQLSGAVINPKAIKRARDATTSSNRASRPSTSAPNDYFYAFTRKYHHQVAHSTPPMFKKKGYHVAFRSSNVVKWMAEKCEEARCRDLPRALPPKEVLTEGDRVHRRSHRRHGRSTRTASPRDQFQPGMDILAKVTVFGEGVRGSCTKTAHRPQFESAGHEPRHLRDGDQGNLAGQAREAPARPRHPRLAVPGLLRRDQRHVALRHEGQPGLVRLRHPAGQPRTRTAIPTSQAQKFKTTLSCATCSRRGAGAIRRKDDSHGRPLLPAEALLQRRPARR